MSLTRVEREAVGVIHYIQMLEEGSRRRLFIGPVGDFLFFPSQGSDLFVQDEGGRSWVWSLQEGLLFRYRSPHLHSEWISYAGWSLHPDSSFGPILPFDATAIPPEDVMAYTMRFLDVEGGPG